MHLLLRRLTLVFLGYESAFPVRAVESITGRALRKRYAKRFVEGVFR